jgi:energy-converting hydrogenase Eha subunit A
MIRTVFAMAVATLVVAAFLGLRKLRRSRRFQQASSPALRALPRSITTIGIITIGITITDIGITDIGITDIGITDIGVTAGGATAIGVAGSK